MHEIQQAILDLAGRKNLARMSLREIGREATGAEIYPQKVKYHIDQLLEAGLLCEDEDTGVVERVSRGESRGNFVSLPLMGTAECGPALSFAEGNVQGYIPVSKSIAGSDPAERFIVRAVGVSMNKAHVGDDGLAIEDGDYVVVDGRDRNPSNDEYVLSIIDGMANIKKFHRDSRTGQISLLSESTEEHQPIFIHPDDPVQYYVAGKVKYVIKKPIVSWV